MWKPARRALMVVAVLGYWGVAAAADEDRWTVYLEPLYIQTYGHDPHVLTIQRTDVDAVPATVDQTAVRLETEGSGAFRTGFLRAGDKWDLGAEYFLLLTSQKADSQRAAADGPGGTVDEVTFQVADRAFTSTDPSVVLFYDQLEDTDLEVWTFDLFARRAFTETEDGDFHGMVGLRVGDFDNDYFAVVGEENVDGVFLGSSSNYDLMMGPIVGLSGGTNFGNNRLEGSFRQSVLIGSAELSNSVEDFTGPASAPVFTDRQTFHTTQDVAIPVTEIDVRWRYRLNGLISLGAGLHASAWWDVSVPPGVVPVEDGDNTLHEDTLVFFGASAAIAFTF